MLYLQLPCQRVSQSRGSLQKTVIWVSWFFLLHMTFSTLALIQASFKGLVFIVAFKRILSHSFLFNVLVDTHQVLSDLLFLQFRATTSLCHCGILPDHFLTPLSSTQTEPPGILKCVSHTVICESCLLNYVVITVKTAHKFCSNETITTVPKYECNKLSGYSPTITTTR